MVLLLVMLNVAEQEMFVPSMAKLNVCFPATDSNFRLSEPCGPNLKLPTSESSIDTSITPGGFQGSFVAEISHANFFESWTVVLFCDAAPKAETASKTMAEKTKRISHLIKD